MVAANRARVHLAVILLLFGAAFAADIAAARPSFNDQLFGRFSGSIKSRASVSVAAVGSQGADYIGASTYSDDYYGVEEKEICLQEVARRACTTETTPTGVGIPGQSELWTSDVSCCKDHKYTYGHWTKGNHIGMFGNMQPMGSCDWVGVYPDPDTTTEMSPGVIRVGAVSAVCYLGADAKECGFPSCDHMLLTLQGSYYRVAQAYSYFAQSETNDAVCDAIWIPNNRNRAMSVEERVNRTGATGPAQRAAGAGRALRSERDSATVANYYYGGGDGGYGGGYGGDYHADNRPVYVGPAVVLSGMVSSVVGKHKEKWEGGMFEYVPSFIGTAVPVNTALDATLPWIRDNTYKFTIYRSSGYGYEGGSGSSSASK